MQYKVVGIILFFIIIDSKGSNKAKIIFDDSAVRAFIRLCKSKEIIDTGDINTLLDFPGYQFLIKQGAGRLSKKVWREIFAAALIPTKDSLRKELQQVFYVRKMVRHIKWAKENYGLIAKRLNEIKRELNSDWIIKRAQEYLPKDIPKGRFWIYYIVGLGQGWVVDSIIVISEENGFIPMEEFNCWIVHELHHCWRNLLPTESYVENLEYRGIIQTLKWLETEGIAKMAQSKNIDSLFQKLQHQENEEIEEWYLAYKETNIYLAKLNNAFKDVFKGKIENPYEYVTSILSPKDRWGVYHQVGHVMAMWIEKTLGRDALIECVGKPIKFLTTYQKSALMIRNPKKVYIFDNKVISKLAKLIINR